MNSVQLLRMLCLLATIGIVNGAWSRWSDCSETCDRGIQTRTCNTGPCTGRNSRSCMTIECPLEIDYKHEGCWKKTTHVKLLEGNGNMYLDPNDQVRSCARAAYDEKYTYFVFLNDKCYAAATSADYDNLGESKWCRSGLGTSGAMDVYKIEDWKCPDSADYGFADVPHGRSPIKNNLRSCTYGDSHIQVGGTPLDPVIICCEEVLCGTMCGKKIMSRNCWCDSQCIQHGDCCPEYIDDCSAGITTCSAVGDPHYTSFDNLYYHFMGLCEYTMLDTNCPQSPYNLKITTQNEPWGATASKVKEISVVSDNWELLLMQGKQVKVNGIPVLAPYEVTPLVKITLAGTFLEVTTGFGIRIRWNGWSSLFIDASNEHKGKVCGLCGNFNDNGGDEFIKPDGTPAPTANTFGDSWAAALNCAPTNKRSVDDELKPRGLAEEAEQLCNTLFNSGNIPSCAGTVDQDNYRFSCEMDVEFSLPDTTGGCAVVADYVTQCMNKGLTIGDWRTGTECEIECPSGMEYTICGSSCPPSCLIPYPMGSCTERCTEGCFCQEGLLLDEGGTCIEKADCGCYYLDKLYRYGEVLPIDIPCCCNITNTICDGSRYFQVNTDQVSWFEARGICKDRGGKLAMLNTETSNTYVTNYIQFNNLDDEVKSGFWIGLDDTDTEGSFVWIDGTSFTGSFSNWGKGEPNNKSPPKKPKGQDCVQLSKKRSLKWYDAHCAHKKGYICELSSLC